MTLFILGIIAGQLLSGPLWMFVHEIVKHRRKVAADVKVQLLNRNF